MNEERKFVVFQVRTEEYAIPISHVISIEKVEEINRIPQLPSYVIGVVKSRGHLIPVIDIENTFYQGALLIDETVRILVLRGKSFEFGLIVADAKEIIEIAEEKIEKIGLFSHYGLSYMSGIANLHSRLITVINPNSFIESLEGVERIDDYIKEAVELKEPSAQ
ncbi:chemotaxis protein CheW [Cytobacillus purgationiresistens]|uniref:Chemotaxis protein CheW n=1 Tax=Cytobacillus purgationiresistens TaxID=863449 RepID=A0ABU0AG25_9BACI|nr:chemotaxis protein CheW [Cytobacillus purgationiresistens]MDQ0269358.1 purine-binding chemotaxis protein CheW [Cytobacillus purgationiresistens]